MMGLLICQRSGIIMVLFGSYILTKVFQKKKLDPKNVLFILNFSFSQNFGIVPSFHTAVDRYADIYRHQPIYWLSADISVLPITEKLIGIGYRYRPIRRPISVAIPI